MDLQLLLGQVYRCDDGDNEDAADCLGAADVVVAALVAAGGPAGAVVAVAAAAAAVGGSGGGNGNQKRGIFVFSTILLLTPILVIIYTVYQTLGKPIVKKQLSAADKYINEFHAKESEFEVNMLVTEKTFCRTLI